MRTRGGGAFLSRGVLVGSGEFRVGGHGSQHTAEPRYVPLWPAGARPSASQESGGVPGVDHRNVETFEVAYVAGSNGEVVGHGGSSDEGVGQVQHASGALSLNPHDSGKQGPLTID